MLNYILIPLLINIVLMLVLTLIIAAMTLIERKILSLMQRRVGPQFVGYKGRLQYIADALKLFLKGALIPDEANKFFFVTMPAFVATICYSFWLNALWGPSISIFEIEFNIVFASLFSALFTLCIILTGYFSKNKYAMLGAIRAGIGMLNLELFLGLLFLNLLLISESFSFLSAVTYQEVYWLIILFMMMLGIILITFLLEVNRAPFDLSEAESELVSGYMTEYGGFFFGVYYLGEYLHLYFFSLLLSTLFLGGWELPNFLWLILFNLHDTLIILPNYVQNLIINSMLFDIFSFLNIWLPWFNFLNLTFIIQFFLLYSLYTIFISSNLYYVLFYIIFQIFLLGIFLSYYQLEIFTAFLWLTEVVIVLACLFILFNTTPSGNVNKILKNYFINNFSSTLFVVFLVSLNFTYWNQLEYSKEFFFNTSFFFDDYYEALHNKNTNDLYGIFLSFYLLNSIEFLIIGIVLLVGSLICVQLNKFLKTNKSLSYISFFEIYDIFKDFSKILFLRKQNLTDQENSKSSTRSFSKKNKK